MKNFKHILKLSISAFPLLPFSSVLAATYDEVVNVEKIALWQSTPVSIQTTNNASQGDLAIKIGTGGYSDINSAVFKTNFNPTIFGLDLFVPESADSHKGQIQLYISCPSKNVYNKFVDSLELAILPSQKYQRIEFDLPGETVTELNGGCTDTTIRISANTPTTLPYFLIDNIDLKPTEGLEDNAKSYAAENNVEFEESLARLERQELIADLENEYRVNFEDLYAGTVIRHSPEYQVEFLVKKSSDSRHLINALNHEISMNNWQSFARVEEARFSLKQLKNKHARTIKILNKIDIDYSAAISEKRNIVIVQVEDEHELIAQLSQAELTLPLGTTIEENEMPSTAATAIGGLKLTSLDAYSCTSGFAVKDEFGNKGFLTSGHCNDNLFDTDGNLYQFQDEIYFGKFDAQWMIPFGVTPENKIKTCDFLGFTCGSQTITSIKPRIFQVEGTYVCKFGVTTGKTCGYIDSIWASSAPFDDPIGPSGDMINVLDSQFVSVVNGSQQMAEPGDSGGPWYSGSTAYGVTHGFRGTKALYMAIDFIAPMGVTVLTE